MMTYLPYVSIALFLYVAYVLWKSGHTILALLVAAGQVAGAYMLMQAKAS
jgi:UPF0716 family protein affecting phage T7 exclusion